MENLKKESLTFDKKSSMRTIYTLILLSLNLVVSDIYLSNDPLRLISCPESLIFLESEFKLDKERLKINDIIPLRLIDCGAYGCVFQVCYHGNLNAALKVGEISQNEVDMYKAASKLDLVPFLLGVEKVRDRTERSINLLLTDLYPTTLVTYIQGDFDRDLIRKVLLPRLEERAIENSFYHGDLHLNNIMIGADLIDIDDDLARTISDSDFMPIKLIDLSFSDLNRPPIAIVNEWRNLYDYFYLNINTPSL